MLDAGLMSAKDLPARTGLSKEALAMALGYLQRRELAVIGPERLFRLAPKGHDAFGEFCNRAKPSEGDALGDVLARLLDQTEALASGFTPPKDGWRGRSPYLAQIRRLLSDPLRALPWHPMVLHRGGWPDGS